jgi:hypothetical protein
MFIAKLLDDGLASPAVRVFASHRFAARKFHLQRRSPQ